MRIQPFIRLIMSSYKTKNNYVIILYSYKSISII